MPIQTITTNDQFSDWFDVTNELVTAVNTLNTAVGDRQTLTTTSKIVVGAINEIAGQTIDQVQNPTLAGSQYVKIPSGPTSARPADPKQGMLRYNTDLDTYEAWNASDDFGVLTSIAVNAASANGTDFPTAVLTGGTAEVPAVIEVHAGVASVSINDAGSGYTVNDVLSFDLGTGTEATYTVTAIGASGEIAGLSLTTSGDYTAFGVSTSGISVTGGTGTGALVDVTANVISIDVVSGGEGYNSAPLVNISGTGLTQTAVSTIGTVGSWGPIGGAENVELLTIGADGSLIVNNSGTSNGIRINQTGEASSSSSSGGALNIQNTSNPGSAFVIYTNNGSGQNGHLMQVRSNNAAFDRQGIFLDYAGTNTGMNIVNRRNQQNVAFDGGNTNVALNVTSYNRDISAFWIRGNEVDSGTVKITHTGQGTGGVATDSVAAGLSIAMNMSDDTLLGTSGASDITKSAAKGFFINYGLSTGKPFQIVGYSDATGTPIKRELYNLDAQGRLTLPLQPFARCYATTSQGLTPGVGALVDWSFIDNNGDTPFTSSNGRVYLPTDGWYNINISVIAANVGDWLDVRLLRNTDNSNGGFIGTGRGSGGSGTQGCASFSTTAFFAGGQYLAVEIMGGTFYDSSTATNPFCNMSINLMA